MARGETRFGGTRQAQLLGPGAPRRGGDIGITRQTAELLVAGAAAATATNYGIIFTVPAISINRDMTGASATGAVWQITSVRARWETAGSVSAALMVVKVPSGTAKSAGTNCLASAIDATAVADTNVDATLHATKANYQFADGDSMALVASGTLTALAGVFVEVEIKRIG
jgi:hypothetical protein